MQDLNSDIVLVVSYFFLMTDPYLNLLEMLRSHYQLPAFPDPLPSTQFHLKLENGLTITIDWHPETEMVELFSTVGTYPSELEAQVMKVMMQANYLREVTAGGTFSARLDKKEIYLAYESPIVAFVEGREEDFVELIGKFGAVASDWKNLLQEISEGGATTPTKQVAKNS